MNNFDKVCPNGWIAEQVNRDSPVEHEHDDNRCPRCNTLDIHECTECGDEITDNDCENYDGLCYACMVDIHGGN